MTVPEWEVPRLAVIDNVAEWLTGTERLFLLVGEPGAGKTVAARQVVAAHAGELGSYAVLRESELALAHFCRAQDERSLNPTDFVAALSDGLARTVSGFAAARDNALAGLGVRVENTVAQQVGVAHGGARITGVEVHLDSTIPLREVYAAAVRRPLTACEAPGRRVLVVIDDLSASLVPGDIDHTIVAVMRMVSAGEDALPSWLRFLITSRPDAVALRDLDGMRCDIDAELAHDELDEYVGSSLTAAASRWRDRIVTAANGNFLVAKHMVDDAVLGRAAWTGGDGPFPQSLSEIYHQWATASREAAGAGWRHRFVPILEVLAVARGAGLTMLQMAGITGLHRADVRDVVEALGQFLRTEGEPAQVAIYHDSFRDFLLATEVEPTRAHEAIVGHFVAASGGDWFTADRYAVEHLATHASVCGRLAELIESPAFLAVAEPSTLVPALAGRDDANSRVYRAVAWLLIDAPAVARVSQLELFARWMQVDGLAHALAALPVDRPWQPVWTHKVRESLGLTLAQIPDGVLAMVLVEVDGRPAVAVQGVAAGIWLLALDGRTAPIPLVEFPWAVAMAGAVVDGRSVLLVSDGERLALMEVPSTRLTDLPAGDSLVTALGLANAGEGLMAVTGHEDGTIRVLDLAAHEIIANWPAHGGLVTCLDVETHGDELRIISGGADGAATMWFISRGGADDRAIRIYQDDDAWVGAVSLMKDGADTTVLVATSDGVGRIATHPFAEGTGVMWEVHSPAGDHVLFDLAKAGQRQRMTQAHLAEHVRFSDVVGRVRRPLAIRGGVNCIVGRWIHGEPVAVTSGQDGKIVLARPRGGGEPTELWGLFDSEVPVGPVLLASIDSSLVLLYAQMRQPGTIGRIEISGPNGLLPALIENLPGPAAGDGELLSAVAALATDGISSVAALLSSGDVVMWEASSGDPFTHYGQKDCEIVAVALAARNQSPLLAAVGWMRDFPFVLLMERPGTGPASRFDAVTSLAQVHAVAIMDPEAGTLLVGGVARDGRAGLVRLVPTRRSRWRPLSRYWEEEPIHIPQGHLTIDDVTFVVEGLRTLTIGPHTHVIAYGSNYSIWHIPPVAESPPVLVYYFHWHAEPVLAHWRGRPAILVASWDRLSMRCLDDPLDEQPITDLVHSPIPQEITAIAAVNIERLLVVGGSDGTVTVWRDGATTSTEVIHLSASVRHLLLLDDRTLLVSTSESTTALRLGS